MKVIGIKFKDGGKIYYFAPKNNETYEEGMEVVVETSKSTEFAVVAFPPKDVPDAEVVQPLKPVVRIATNKDREQVKKNAERKPGAMKIAEEKIRKHNLDMKLIDCEFTFDGTKVIFYFAADGRVDFRELVKDLASVFHIRIELRQNEYYSEIYKKMPKLGSEATTPEGKGTVVSENMLKQTVRVKIENKDGSLVYKDFPLDKIVFKGGKKEEPDDKADKDLKNLLD